MDLKGILNKKGKKEYFWAFVLEPDWVQAGIWSIEDGIVSVSSVGPSSAWKSDEELVSSADTALSAAVQSFPEGEEEPAKTVFGVSNSWVVEGQIKEEYLRKIKTICSELSLTPIGFVVLSEAIAHIVKTEEKIALSAIIVGVGTESVEVSILKEGKTQGFANVARSVSFHEDLVEGLVRISSENLPLRIILYNGKDVELEEIRQSLESVRWEEKDKIRFLHPPRIEILSSEKKVMATALAGGSELANTSGIKTVHEVEVEEQGDETPRTSKSEDREPSTDDSGFVIGEDIQNVQEARIEESDQITEGFLQETASGAQQSQSDSKIDHAKLVDETFDQERVKKGNLIFSITGFLSRIIPKLESKKSLPGTLGKSKRVWIAGAVGFLIFFSAAFIFWWFYPRATVTVYVSSKKIEDRISLSVDPNLKDLNVEEKIIPGEIVKVEVQGDKTMPTSGKKTVGERASGKVTIYRSGTGVDLESGTKLESTNGLEFTINDDVSVASGSASSPGKTEVNVTASDIGSQYNLASSTSLSVGNYPLSELEAKNDSDFSGGSSREISAVSEEDQSDLEEELKSELVSNARDKFLSSISEGKILVEEASEETVLESDFSNKIGDESSNLKLNLTMQVEAIVVNKKDLVDFAKKELGDKVPGGYVLRDEQISVDFEFNGEEDGIYNLDAIFRANLLPEVNIDELAAKIAGKYPDIAQEYLLGIEGFSRAEIDIDPKLPGKLKSLPHVKDKIFVTVASSN